MKNALILHGLGNTSQGNWFPWLKNELEERGYKVWVPDLPHSHQPNLQKSINYIFDNWLFDEESIIIGHSAGSVTAMGILEHLSDDIVIDKTILVSAFNNDLGWPELRELFLEPMDFAKIKKHARKIVLLHSDDDPYISLDQPEYIAKQIDAKLIVKKGQGHFNSKTVEADYAKFPFLLELIFRNKEV